jgi:2,5-diketo-D-gluconate reductase B
MDGVTDSLERMDLEYIDLLYVHWPVGNYNPRETLPALEDLRNRNLIKHIGVSNFSVELLEEARDELNSPLFAHQVEMHPLLYQEELLSYAQTHNHYLVAYSPLARGRVVDIPEIQEVAKKHGVSEAQVSLAWLLSKDRIRVIPKASSPDHIRDNFAARDLRLDFEDIKKINRISQSERFVERDGAPWQA